MLKEAAGPRGMAAQLRDSGRELSLKRLKVEIAKKVHEESWGKKSYRAIEIEQAMHLVFWPHRFPAIAGCTNCAREYLIRLRRFVDVTEPSLPSEDVTDDVEIAAKPETDRIEAEMTPLPNQYVLYVQRTPTLGVYVGLTRGQHDDHHQVIVPLCAPLAPPIVVPISDIYSTAKGAHTYLKTLHFEELREAAKEHAAHDATHGATQVAGQQEEAPADTTDAALGNETVPSGDDTKMTTTGSDADALAAAAVSSVRVPANFKAPKTGDIIDNGDMQLTVTKFRLGFIYAKAEDGTPHKITVGDFIDKWAIVPD